MAKRKIIRIDEEKCNGCGQCADACAEGALQIVDGKAKLVKDSFCDGLGACIGDCPMDALFIEERESDEFDEEAVKEHLEKIAKAAKPAKPEPCTCPGMKMMSFDEPTAACDSGVSGAESKVSQLRQWPVQLTLVPVSAPYFENADLMLVADCVPFAVPDFHSRLLKSRSIAIACPKLDDVDPYISKLAEMIVASNLKGITILRMEVPCCSGLIRIAKMAVATSGRDIPVKEVIMGIRGSIGEEKAV